jgi:hypothetical protein
MAKAARSGSYGMGELGFLCVDIPEDRVAAGDLRHEAVLHEEMARMAAFGALPLLDTERRTTRFCP